MALEASSVARAIRRSSNGARGVVARTPERQELDALPGHVEGVQLLVPAMEVGDRRGEIVRAQDARRDLDLHLVELADVAQVRRSAERHVCGRHVERGEPIAGLSLHVRVQGVDPVRIQLRRPADVRAGEVASDVHREHPERRVGRGDRRDDDGGDVERIRDRRGMDRTGAATRDHREVADVVAAPGRDLGDLVRHVRVGGHEDRRGGLGQA